MQFSLFAIAALAADTSSSCIVLATAAAAAARKRKITKKVGSLSGSYGATRPTDGNFIPFGDPCDPCTNSNDLDCTVCCAIPPGLDHGYCSDFNTGDDDKFQSGQPGSWCVQASNCVVQNDLDPPHAVCRGTQYGNMGKCQR